MTAERVLRAGLLIGAVALLTAIQFYLTAPRPNLLWTALFDAGHTPLFGVHALVVLGLLDTVWPDPGGRRARRYVLAFAVAFAGGGLLEVIQYFGPRDAEVIDVVRNGAGAASFLLFAATFDDRLAIVNRTLLRAGAVLLLIAALAPAMQAAGAYVARSAALPRLCAFGSPWESFFVSANPHAEFEWTDPRGDREDRWFCATFRPGPYAVLSIEPYPDWTGYDTLRLSVYSPVDEAVTLAIKIEDEADIVAGWNRYTGRLRIEPGSNELTVPLDEVRNAPRDRQLDLEHVRRVQLFMSRLTRPVTLYIEDLRLE